MTNIQLHHLHRAAPGKYFARSLGRFPQNHEEKIANRHTVAMRQCTKKHPPPPLVKVIFDGFFVTTKIQLHYLERTAPCKFFLRCLGPLPQTDEEKLQTGLLWPCAQEKPHPYKSDFRPFFRAMTNTTSPSGGRSPCKFFVCSLGPLPQTVVEKFQTGLLWPCASAQKGKHS